MSLSDRHVLAGSWNCVVTLAYKEYHGIIVNVIRPYMINPTAWIGAPRLVSFGLVLVFLRQFGGFPPSRAHETHVRCAWCFVRAKRSCAQIFKDRGGSIWVAPRNWSCCPLYSILMRVWTLDIDFNVLKWILSLCCWIQLMLNSTMVVRQTDGQRMLESNFEELG
jgi:hypothetical protein